MLQDFFATGLQFLIEQNPLRWHENRDWQKEGDRFRRPGLDYPAYYKNHNFHSIKDGYLSVEAAVSYDFVSQCLLLPNEGIIRHSLVNLIQGQPQHILDLGCGTGSMTLALKQAFPTAEVIGLDLSPYMLIVAANKAKHIGVNVQFLQGNAEQTEFADRSFDLVTASLLFHETPSIIANKILRESYRLLNKSGEVAVLDGNQEFLRQMNWIKPIFEEPYITDYIEGDVAAWIKSAGFTSVQSHSVWWMQQVSHGVKSE